MAKPELLKVPMLEQLYFQQGERYLPTAFDDTLTLLEKINRMIERLNVLGELTQDMIDKWNEVVDWITNEGLHDTVKAILEQWLIEGKFDEIFVDLINDLIKTKADIAYVDEQISNMKVDGTVTINVGSSQTYKTIQSVLNYLSSKRPTYRGKIIIQLQTGFVMREQVVVRNLDFSYVTITSNNAENTIETAYLTTKYDINQSPEFTVAPAFACFDGTLPKIDVLFRMDTKETIHENVTGIFLQNSRAMILPNKGVLDSNFIGICAISGSNVHAPYSNFSNSGNREKLNTTNYATERYGDCYRIWASTLTAPYSKAQNGGDVGYNISMASTANLNYADGSGCGHHGLLATTASNVSARNSTFNNIIDDAVVAYASSNIDLRKSTLNDTLKGSGLVATRSSHINFEEGTGARCFNGVIYANRGSSVDADGAVVRDCALDNITCANGSMLNFNNGVTTGSGQDNLHINHGCVVSAYNMTSDNAGEDGVLAYGSAIVSCENARISNSKLRAFEASSGAKINARGSVCSNSLGGSDFSVYYGSEINAYNASGTANRTLNTLTADGIIYKK